MLWNRQKQRDRAIHVDAAKARVEIQKEATEEAVQEAKQASQHLTHLLTTNGFTIKLFLAAHNPRKKNGL